jgi:predicted GNAT family acetyltransferase
LRSRSPTWRSRYLDRYVQLNRPGLAVDAGEGRSCNCARGGDGARMNAQSGEISVRHNSAENRFEVIVDGRLSVADYQLRDGEMVMTHTYVPPELRGRGIAEKLVRAALEYAKAEQLRVVPACSYVDVFIQRHAEYRSLVS